MKTFKDLLFKAHKIQTCFETHAEMHFKNGYGIVVVTGEYAYSDNEKPYEVAILKGDNICYDTPITNDVIGYCTADMVSDLMIKIQNLQPYEEK